MIIKLIVEHRGYSEKKLKQALETLTKIKVNEKGYFWTGHRKKCMEALKELKDMEILHVEKVF